MAKKAPTLSSVRTDSREQQEKILPPSGWGTRLRKRSNPPRQSLWLGGLLLVGLVILGLASFTVWNWLKNIHIPDSANAPSPPITSLQVQRTVSYAGLDFTVLTAQSATFFTDDDIHSESATVRLTLRVTNQTTNQTALVYYDVARLLAPKLNPIAPSNVQLSAGFKLGSSETGWIDFAVPVGLQLNTLHLQLGNTLLSESLVTVPFTGAFDPNRYASRISPQSLTIPYAFYVTVNHVTFLSPTLIYHLTSVYVGYSYQGNQCKAGQQFYVLNFSVDNPNDTDISPGLGFNYVRLVLNGTDRPPFDTTLPASFKAGAKGIVGQVAFSAPAGLRTITIGFRVQSGLEGQDYDVGV